VPRKIKMPVGSPAFWSLEAEPSELQDYVTSRLRRPSLGELSSDGFPIEPAWFCEAFDASWPVILAEADAR
jgi:hypothetical protein